jgi:hypothetical protein
VTLQPRRAAARPPAWQQAGSEGAPLRRAAAAAAAPRHAAAASHRTACRKAQVEERCVSIISNLFYGLAAKGERRQRLAAKFVEAEFEKCDRLLEVFFK